VIYPARYVKAAIEALLGAKNGAGPGMRFDSVL